MDQKESSAGKQLHDEDVLTLLAHQTQGTFAPGTKWAYSNSGYVVLGLIVAKVAQMPYAEFLHRPIFSPLKMSHTVAYAAGQNTISDRAYGYDHGIREMSGFQRYVVYSSMFVNRSGAVRAVSISSGNWGPTVNFSVFGTINVVWQSL